MLSKFHRNGTGKVIIGIALAAIFCILPVINGFLPWEGFAGQLREYPITVFAISTNGGDAADTSRFVKEKVIPELERIEGVESVTAVGLVKERVEVVLHPEETQKQNRKRQEELQGREEQAEKALETARSEAESGELSLEEGKQTENAQAVLEVRETLEELNLAHIQLAQAKTGLAVRRQDLEEKQRDLDTQKAQEETWKQDYKTLCEQTGKEENTGRKISQEQTKELETLKEKLQNVGEYDENTAQIQGVIKQIKSQEEGVDEALSNLEAEKEKIEQLQSQAEQGDIGLDEAREELGTGRLEDILETAAECEDMADTATEGTSEQTAADLDITSEEVKELLAAENFEKPAGYAKKGENYFRVRVENRLHSIEELERLPVGEGKQGIVHLADVADIGVETDEDTAYARVNGDHAVFITVERERNSLAGVVRMQVSRQIDRLKREYTGMKCIDLLDPEKDPVSIFYTTLRNLIFGGILAGLAGFFFHRVYRKKTAFFEKLKLFWGVLLIKILRRRWVILSAAFFLLIFSSALAILKEKKTVPESQTGWIALSLETEEKATFEENKSLAEEVTQRMQNSGYLKNIAAFCPSGYSDGTFRSEDKVRFYIQLKDRERMSTEAWEKVITETVEGLPCTLKVQEIGEIAENLSGRTDGGTKQLKVVVDREEAAKYDLTAAQVYQKLEEELSGTETATVLSTLDGDFDVVVTDASERRAEEEDIREIILSVEQQDGTECQVPLKEIAKFEEMEDEETIDRETGITRENLPGIAVLIFLALYLVLAVYLKSFRLPFVISFSAICTLTGAFLAFLTVGEIGISGILAGLVIALAVSVTQGIAFIDTARQLLAEGMEREKALIRTGQMQLYPVVKTVLTVTLLLSIIALGIGRGTSAVQPAAVLAIGGALYSIWTTLFIVPCVFDLSCRRKKERTEKRTI